MTTPPANGGTMPPHDLILASIDASHEICNTCFDKTSHSLNVTDVQKVILERLVAAERSGWERAKERAAKVARKECTWVNENSYESQVDMRSRIVAAIQSMKWKAKK